MPTYVVSELPGVIGPLKSLTLSAETLFRLRELWRRHCTAEIGIKGAYTVAT